MIGNLMTAKIMIEDGADFKGTIEIDRSPTKDADKSISWRAASAGGQVCPGTPEKAMRESDYDRDYPKSRRMQNQF